jgi:hypothetical protein
VPTHTKDQDQEHQEKKKNNSLHAFALPKIFSDLDLSHVASTDIATEDLKLAAQISKESWTSFFAHSGKLLYVTSNLETASRFLVGTCGMFA